MMMQGPQPWQDFCSRIVATKNEVTKRHWHQRVGVFKRRSQQCRVT